jgi:hypothetical protein
MPNGQRRVCTEKPTLEVIFTESLGVSDVAMYTVTSL